MDDLGELLDRDASQLSQLSPNCLKDMLLTSRCNYSADLTLENVSKLPPVEAAEYLKMFQNRGCAIAIPSYLTLLNTDRSHLALHLLNPSQRNVVFRIMEALSCSFNTAGELMDPKLLILDAPSGTGKSFLIDCMSLSSNNQDIVILANTNKLLDSICTVTTTNTQSYTICKFIMNYFLIEYKDAITIFKDVNTEDRVITLVNTLVEKRSPGTLLDKDTKEPWIFNLLIVDEYSLVSPILLIVLRILAIKENFNIIFMGDINQQNTLNSSKLHHLTNFNLFNQSAKQVFELNEQMRIKDGPLLDLITMLKTFIEHGKPVKGNVYNNYHIHYQIFTRCVSKFFSLGHVLTDIYLSATHKMIKARLGKLEAYAIKQKLVFKKEPFVIIHRETNMQQPLVLNDQFKFQSSLLLVQGATYVHNHQFVILDEINKDSIKVRNPVTNVCQILTKVIWTSMSHPCVDVNFTWMESHYDTSAYYLVQYPLMVACLTYFFVQGLTFPTETLCLDLDVPTTNSLYVGLSRVKQFDQIKCIETVNRMNFLYTLYKNDEFYYKLNTISQELMADLLKFYKDRSYTFVADVKTVPVNLLKFNNPGKLVNTIKCNRALFNTVQPDNDQKDNSNKKIKLETTPLAQILNNLIEIAEKEAREDSSDV